MSATNSTPIGNDEISCSNDDCVTASIPKTADISTISTKGVKSLIWSGLAQKDIDWTVLPNAIC